MEKGIACAGCTEKGDYEAAVKAFFAKDAGGL